MIFPPLDFLAFFMPMDATYSIHQNKKEERFLKNSEPIELSSTRCSCCLKPPTEVENATMLLIQANLNQHKAEMTENPLKTTCQPKHNQDIDAEDDSRTNDLIDAKLLEKVSQPYQRKFTTKNDITSVKAPNSIMFFTTFEDSIENEEIPEEILFSTNLFTANEKSLNLRVAKDPFLLVQIYWHHQKMTT